MPPRILLIEDEHAIRGMLKLALEQESYTIVEAVDGSSAFASLAEQLPDLILLDWMLPDTSGPKILRKLRKDDISKDIPVIMLTARTEEKDMVTGLQSGADDYITKPFSVRELLARISALLRRTHGLKENHILSAGAITIDLNAHQVKIADEDVHLGKTEYRLLKFFVSHPNRVYSRGQLLDYVWGPNIYIEERTVDVHILRLRKQLKPYNLDRAICTIRGAGYRFTLPS